MIEKVADAAKKIGEVGEKFLKETGKKVMEGAENIVKEGGELAKHPEGEIPDLDMDILKNYSLESIKIENDDNPNPWWKGLPEKNFNIAGEDTDIGKVPESLEKVGLTVQEKATIKEEMGWSDEIIDCIEGMDQYKIYKDANLHEAEINGRKCLIKDIDYDYVDPKTGMTNRELMEKGRPPIDPKTGETIEIHHMGQEYDAPFAELCENSEHGDGKHKILHTKQEGSWRNNPELESRYNNVDRPNHWKERAKEA